MFGAVFVKLPYALCMFHLTLVPLAHDWQDHTIISEICLTRAA